MYTHTESVGRKEFQIVLCTVTSDGQFGYVEGDRSLLLYASIAHKTFMHEPWINTQHGSATVMSHITI